jgi:hypothetical protein
VHVVLSMGQSTSRRVTSSETVFDCVTDSHRSRPISILSSSPTGCVLCALPVQFQYEDRFVSHSPELVPDPDAIRFFLQMWAPSCHLLYDSLFDSYEISRSVLHPRPIILGNPCFPLHGFNHCWARVCRHPSPSIYPLLRAASFATFPRLS